MTKKCINCGLESGKLLSGNHESQYVLIKGRDYCTNCSKRVLEKVMEKVIVTTTNSIDGYSIEKYISIESVEVVIGTGVFSEFSGEMADFFGTRSSAFEIKMQNAKRAAISRMKIIADEHGGDAIVGMDLDYTEFSGNRIGVIANGTIVKLQKKYQSNEEKLLDTF